MEDLCRHCGKSRAEVCADAVRMSIIGRQAIGPDLCWQVKRWRKHVFVPRNP